MTPTLPPQYLAAEAVARPGLDRPDHDKLDQLLKLSVEEAGRLVATTPDAVDLALREALPRAARILDPYTYVPIADFDWSAITTALHSGDPIMRRFAAAQYFIGTIVDRADGTVGAPAQLIDFSTLGPDGTVDFVPYVEPKIVAVTPPVAADPGVTPATVAVVQTQHGETFLQHLGDDLHAAILRALAWIKRL